MAEATEPALAQTSNQELFQQAAKQAFELHNTGRHVEAEVACRALLNQDPRDGQLLFLLGMVLHKQGRSREALEHMQTAAALHPRSARILNGLGFVQHHLKNHAHAVKSYSRAVALGMQAADTWYGMGNSYYQLGEVERAIDCFQKAVTLAPRDTASWNNLGKCLNESNRLDDSLAAYDQAIAIDPHYSLARYGRALTLLGSGHWPEGFREYNQWRSHGIKPREFPRPQWLGEMIPGRALFLHAEQGYGDAILYARFLPPVRERAAKVILECRPELKSLFLHSGIADEIIAYGEAIPPFDYFTSQASLPGILGVELNAIPNQVPYLKAPPTPRLISAPSENLKVGLAWAGNPSHHNDAARSLRLEDLIPLLQVPEVTFYSLQTPVPARDQSAFRLWSGIVGLSAGFTDFLTTAGAVANMDLVISVDSAITHLAGALARPVWTLLPFAPDWRWLLDRQDTPWYPTMRLFRQTQRNQWAPVIAKAAAELACRIVNRSG
jgi:tetratricopeptide (TPR) repeat protein